MSVQKIAGQNVKGSEIARIVGGTDGIVRASKAVIADANKVVSGMTDIPPTQVAAASGAISIKHGIVVITKAGVAAMTLADPVATDDDYKRLTVISATASAHTVSNAAGSGFNGGGAASDVGTFGGAKGDGITLIAYQGVWYVIDKTNVTLA
ncbi:MAG: hypothetical protein WBV94_25205 [Blastocatellia bacterium]